MTDLDTALADVRASVGKRGGRGPKRPTRADLTAWRRLFAAAGDRTVTEVARLAGVARSTAFRQRRRLDQLDAAGGVGDDLKH